jgi:hypothetical protein
VVLRNFRTKTTHQLMSIFLEISSYVFTNHSLFNFLFTSGYYGTGDEDFKQRRT